MRLFLALARPLMLALFVLLASFVAADAQTSAFTYQGRFTSGSMPANGTYTMKFRLYGSLDQTDQIGAEQTALVTATNGIFSVELDFGAASFPAGANRWLEVQIATTTLAPRQKLNASPFAVRSLDANQADALSTICNPCVTDAQIVGLSGSKITGSVPQADNAASATTATTATTSATATNALNLGGVGASDYLQKSGGAITGNLSVGGVLSGDGSGLTNLPSGGFAWQEVTGTSQQAVSNKGYIANNPTARVTITLPAAPNVGDVVRITGAGAGGWKVAQNAGQTIRSNIVTNSAAWTPRESSREWRSIASSADGTKLVAVVGGGVSGGQIYTSTDSGLTWTPRESNRQWWAVASSADGTKLVAAVTDGGQIYTSTDSGISWTPRESNRQWWAVASSADGTKLVAVVTSGQIYTSIDSGITWTPRETGRQWRAVASSADGTKLAAAVSSGQIYISFNSGLNWTPTESSRAWWSIAMSADGVKLAAVVNDGQIYTSTDSGFSWTPRESTRSWRSIASSADGNKLVAVVGCPAINGCKGQIHISTDSGFTWTPRESNRQWYSVASSADGTRLAAAAIYGQIYTNAPLTSSTVGAGGYITGSETSSVELQYVGNGKFVWLSHEGEIVAF